MPLSALEMAVCVLAAYRATRLLVKDSLFAPWRDRIIVWSTRRGPRAARFKVGELVECPYCMGMWLSWATYTCAAVALGRVGRAPLLAHLIAAWAVAGGQALLNALDALLNAANEVAQEETQ